MTSLQYLRYVAYALFAVGIINLRYQSGEEDLGIRTFLIVGTGVVLFALTYFNFGKKSSRDSGWENSGLDSCHRGDTFCHSQLANPQRAYEFTRSKML